MLWTVWLIAVSVNVVVWALVSATTASLIYPWPLWVAGPYGAVLLALSIAAAQARRGRPAAPGRGAGQPQVAQRWPRSAAQQASAVTPATGRRRAVRITRSMSRAI